MRQRLLVATALSLVLASHDARADTEERVKRLEQIILDQQRKLSEQEKRLKELETRRTADPEAVRGTPRAPRVVSSPPGSAAQPEAAQQPFANGVRQMFEALSDEGLATQRGGGIPVYRVELPSGASVLVPAAMIQQFLAQQPRDPTFEVEPERPPQQQQPPRRPPPRVAPRRAPPPVARPAPPQPPPQPTPPAPPPASDEDRAKAQKAQDQALLERGAILLRPGALQIEPGLEYSKFSGNNVQISGVSIFDAIIIGFIRVDANDRDLLTGTLRARYGVINRVQVDATLPYIYRRDHEVLGIGTPNVRDRSFSGNGIGDVELGVSGQPLIGRGWVPNVLVRVFTRIPTGESSFQIPTVPVGPGGENRLSRSPSGTGFYAVGGTVTAVLPIDPVVLFAGGGYTMNFPRTWGQFGRIDPGDTWEFFAGLNFALNERVSFNFSFIQQRSLPTSRDGTRLVNTSATDARAIFGTSVGLSRSVNLVMNAGVGLTPASPNFTFFVSLPITFQVFD
jgi:hypothetical protein